MKHIWLVERNIHGVWTIRGKIGTRSYYFSTKRNAIRQYNAECKVALAKEAE